MKKIRQVALSYRKIKNKYWKADMYLQGVPGVSKDVPGSTKHAIWGLLRKYSPKLKNIENTKKKAFFDIFFNFDDFSKFVPFWVFN